MQPGEGGTPGGIVPDLVNLRLARMRQAMDYRLSRSDVEFRDVSVVAGKLGEQFAFQLQWDVWSRKYGRHEIRWPKTWWDAFKARWFTPWMLQRWPPAVHIEVLDVREVYPEFQQRVPMGVIGKAGLAIMLVERFEEREVAQAEAIDSARAMALQLAAVLQQPKRDLTPGELRALARISVEAEWLVDGLRW